MSRTPPRGTIARSALGWLQRLGWEYLAPNRRCALRGNPATPVLEGRLREYLQQLRVGAHGEQWPLDADGIAQVLAAVVQRSLRRGTQPGSDALLILLREGVRVVQQRPDGRTMEVVVPLVAWTEPEGNHWDVASAREQEQPLRDAVPRVDVLLGYVNGLPLLRLLCVERDGQGRWGREEAAIALHCRGQDAGMEGSTAPLLLALDRRGGRHASSGTPAEGWVRWREHGWSAARTGQLRRTLPTPNTGATHANGQCLRAVHAPLLAGVAAPARVLTLLRGFMHPGADGRLRLARAAQFFAVQAGLAQLRRIDAQGGRGRGYLQLAAGSGMALTRQWLLAHLRRDPWLRHCRILLVQPRAAMAPVPCNRAEAALSPGRRLAAFMADGRGCTLQTTPGTLQTWLRRRDGGYDSDDLIVLMDAPLQGNPPAWLDRARQRLPRAGWLWLGCGPLPDAAPDAAADPVLFACTAPDAVADGLVVPVYQQALAAAPPPPPVDLRAATPGPEPAAPGCGRWAAAVAQHLRDTLQHTERDLRALLLVEDAAAMRRYQRAFARDGTVHSALLGPGAGRAGAARHTAKLLIASDVHALPYLDARLALVYVGAALDAPAMARALALVNRPHAHKRCAWLVQLPGVPLPWQHAAAAWAPPSLQQLKAGLPCQHRRLRALLPATASADFHACRDHLGPHWHVDARGQQRDLHRVRRRCLQQRVTSFGQQLQAALLALPGEGDAGAADTPQHRYRYDLHFCSLLRDAVNKEACEQHLSVAEDVRIRHWARERAPEVRDAAWDYLGPAATPPADPRRDADALHSLLRHQLETGTDGHAARLQLQRQLQALLLERGAPEARLHRLQGLLARQAQRARVLEGPGAGEHAPPLLRACRGLLVQTLGVPRTTAQRRLQHGVADQLATAIGAAQAAHPQAPHRVLADLQRRLAPALAAVLLPAQCQTLLAAVAALLADTAFNAGLEP
ncbi:hypothetical protein D3C87_540850 [compost metagenome]